MAVTRVPLLRLFIFPLVSRMSGFVPEAWYTSCFKISDYSFQSGLFLIIFSLENWPDFPASFYVKRFWIVFWML